MSNVLGHRFVSPKLDGPDATQVQPSAWNDGHKFSGGANGQILTRDTSDATFGATWAAPAAAENWTPYTPAWYLNNVLTTLGTHTLVGTYWRRGNAVFYQILFTVGAGAIGAGNWSISLPAPFVAHICSGGGMLISGATVAPLWVTTAFTDRVLLLYLTAPAAMAVFSGTAPVTLVAGAQIELRGNYQAA